MYYLFILFILFIGDTPRQSGSSQAPSVAWPLLYTQRTMPLELKAKVKGKWKCITKDENKNTEREENENVEKYRE